jgi:pilus assembly protein CpaE
MRIALISPNTGNLREMAGTLTALSHQVTSVEGGKGKMRSVAEQHAPDMMLVEGMCCDLAELAQVEHVTTHHPDIAVVLLCATHTPEFLMHSMRAGVREVLPAPAPREQLLAAVARIEAKSRGSRGRPPGRVLAFLPSKGGSGATFLATNIGWQLSQAHSVLLIDLNLQLGDALAVLHDGAPATTLADVAAGIGRLDGSLLAASAVGITPNYSILAAPEDPAQAVAIKPEHVEAILGVASAHYDFVVLDMGRSIDPLSIAALDRADRIFVVTQLGLPALRNARQLLAGFAALGYRSDKTEVIVNRFERGGTLGLEDVKRSLGNVVLRTVPNSWREVSSAIDHGSALVGVARGNPVARTIVEFANSFVPASGAGRSLLQRLLKRA